MVFWLQKCVRIPGLGTQEGVVHWRAGVMSNTQVWYLYVTIIIAITNILPLVAGGQGNRCGRVDPEVY